MEKLNIFQLRALNNLRKVFNDFKNGKATKEELEIAKAKYDRSMNYKPMPTVTKAGTVLATLGLVGTLGSCADRSIVNDEIVNSEEPKKVEETKKDPNVEIQEHQEEFMKIAVESVEEVLANKVLSEDFLSEDFKKNPKQFTEELYRISEMTVAYDLVNSIVEGKPLLTPTDLAVMDKDGSLPTLMQLVSDAHLGETNMEMLLTYAASGPIDYSKFYQNKADQDYLNNIERIRTNWIKGMATKDEALLSKVQEEAIIEKDKLIGDDSSLLGVSYGAIKEGFQKIEAMNISIPVLTEEEQGIINHMIQEKCGEFKDGMTELDVKGTYIYRVMEEYLAKTAKIDASIYTGKTWDELIETIVDKALDDILNKKVTVSLYNEETKLSAIINKYLDSISISVGGTGYVISSGGGCVTTEVGKTTETETKVVTKDKVPTKDLIPKETTYKDHNTGKPITEEEVNKRLKEIEEANAAIETIGNGGSVSEEIINKDEDVKHAVDVTEAAKNYREVEEIPFEGGKEEQVGSIEDVPLSTNAVEPTAEVAKPTKAISSTAIDEQGNRINESYHEFYDTEEVNYEVVNSDDAIYFDDGEVVMSIVTEGGMTK